MNPLKSTIVDDKWLVREELKTLQEWEAMLPDDYFVRIHRSTIVNFKYDDQVKKCRNYSHLVYVRGIEKPFVMS